MIQITDKKLCCGCHGCAQECPKQCIEMMADAEGFFYPKVDESRCIRCGLCEKVCPVLQVKAEDTSQQVAAVAARNLNDGIRQQSSSGGVFTLLAEQIIAEGGVVFGAVWREDYRAVEHIAVRTEAGLAKLRSSKYLQSTIGTCYAQAKESLNRGEAVLFSGTPCQIEGLRRFLGKDYPRLLCVDLVCHGVPAPAVWRHYLQECQEQKNSEVTAVTFRDKSTGWKSYCVTMDFANGEKQSLPVSGEPYMRAFLSNACLRPSCHDCRFKKRNRESDLTLADFWGIEEVCPDMDDNRGTSLVLIHTPAGYAAMTAIRDRILSEPVDVSAALRQNPSAVVSSAVHENREAFLRSLESTAFPSAVKHWLPRKVSTRERIYGIVNRLGLVPLVKKILGRE